jgi:hypothetical protein
VAAAEIPAAGMPILLASVHVGPRNYKKHLLTLVDELSAICAGRRFVLGGDLNAARHLDDVYGARWFTRPRQITDEHIEQVIARTLEELPRGATHWSSRVQALDRT